MHLILSLGIGLSVILHGVYPPPQASFSPIIPTSIAAFDSAFTEYCAIDSTFYFEQNAVMSSFFGDHQKAVYYATKSQALGKAVDQVPMNETEIMLAKEQLEYVLNDDSASSEDKRIAQMMLNLLSHSTTEETFQDAIAHNAQGLIVDSARNYHFLLINEAHYNSQNRAFTRSLLKPLWEEGYRYLALETLWYTDTTLMERGYPVLSTGYYTRDPVFGNLVREALKIGYTLVTYETTAGLDRTLRDQDQARNIYQKTWQQDSVGKVLVHAGYDHIGEVGEESYQPMGAYLKALLGQEILTVEQQEMNALLESTKVHPFYQYAVDHYKLEEPTIFTKDGQVLIDPIRSNTVDVQVYLPITKYEKGIPEWLLSGNSKLYELPPTFEAYDGHLLQAVPLEERVDAIPVDQFVMGPERRSLLLPPGDYQLRIIDCQGTLVGVSEVKIAL